MSADKPQIWLNNQSNPQGFNGARLQIGNVNYKLDVFNGELVITKVSFEGDEQLLIRPMVTNQIFLK